MENNPGKLAAIQKDLTGKGIKQVVKKYAPSLLPRLTSMIVNPRTITSQTSTKATELGVSDQIPNMMQ